MPNGVTYYHGNYVVETNVQESTTTANSDIINNTTGTSSSSSSSGSGSSGSSGSGY